MGVIAQKVLLSLLTSLLTEKFIGSLFVRLGAYLASKTTNELDDGIVEDLRKAIDKTGSTQRK